MMNVHTAIRTLEEYESALAEIESLMNNTQPGTPEGDRMEMLLKLTEEYEDE